MPQPASLPDNLPQAGGITPLLETRGLTRHFRVGGLFSRRTLHAVDDVNLTIYPREIVALVGESGSGKSTIARLLAGIFPPTSGQILYQGKPLAAHSRRDMLRYRRHVQMVFQDPFSFLNPVYPAAHCITRALKLHRPELNRQQRHEEAARLLTAVGLTPAEEFLRKYPYELSGGQRQRYGFAQALASKPDLILADEPVSMLDVSIRIGLLNLMSDLCQQEGVSFLYITHDIASARYIADRILVMYAAQVVETGPVERVLTQPAMPYTQLLLSAVPDPNAPADVTLDAEAGEPPRVVDPGVGCRFRFRCPYRIERCDTVNPELIPVGPEHAARCILAEVVEGYMS